MKYILVGKEEEIGSMLHARARRRRQGTSFTPKTPMLILVSHFTHVLCNARLAHALRMVTAANIHSFLPKKIAVPLHTLRVHGSGHLESVHFLRWGAFRSGCVASASAIRLRCHDVAAGSSSSKPSMVLCTSFTANFSPKERKGRDLQRVQARENSGKQRFLPRRS